MAKKKIAIIGFGPGGMGAAYKFRGNPNFEVTVFEHGKKIMDRRCPGPRKCVHCNKGTNICDKTDGNSGSGPYTDGKMIGETFIGFREVGSNILEYVGTREKEIPVIIEGKEFYKKFGARFSELTEELKRKANGIDLKARQNDMDYILSSQAHIGTDKLPEFMKNIEDYLLNGGIEVRNNENVISFDSSRIQTSKREYTFDHVILAPGRKGADWLEEELKKNNIPVDYRAVDIGFRVETDAAVLEELCSIGRDVKLSFRKKGNGDLIRTFCVCPNGIVSRETYERKGFNLVNGESGSDSIKPSKNTNFALLVSIPLTKRVNCNNYADSIAKTFHLSGGDQVVGHRLGELLMDRRSNESKLKEFRIHPTLEDVYLGDVGLGMPYRIVRSGLYGIGRLSGNKKMIDHFGNGEEINAPPMMPGLDQFSTILYAPEMKRNGLKIKANEYLMVNDWLSIVGDGPGVTRGIVAATASGILAAKGIIKKYSC
ncbi:MAG: FAD-dependent oxidoreductase [Nanoarchaeota archaeon]|nr:FAD-dependent oxidoreductase [Nanoarchaeota archaeon]